MNELLENVQTFTVHRIPFAYTGDQIEALFKEWGYSDENGNTTIEAEFSHDLGSDIVELWVPVTA